MRLAEAFDLAIVLKEQHRLYGWIIELDRSKRRFGYCSHYERKISLSKYLVELNEYVRVRDIILHEIAHALVGPRNGHNEIWKQKALSIGCDGKTCYSVNEVTIPKPKYIGECPKCDYKIKAFRKRRRLTFHKACYLKEQRNGNDGFEIGAITWRKVK